jgi:hypothetical protein
VNEIDPGQPFLETANSNVDLIGAFVRWSCRPLAEQRLIPLEAARHITHPDDRPRTLHDVSGRPNVPVQRRRADLCALGTLSLTVRCNRLLGDWQSLSQPT